MASINARHRAGTEKLVGHALISHQKNSHDTEPEKSLVLELHDGEYAEDSFDFGIEILLRGARKDEGACHKVCYISLSVSSSLISYLEMHTSLDSKCLVYEKPYQKLT